MTRASRWLRRIEISLWILGISLCGVALEATVDRWQYQEQQERALFAAANPPDSTAPVFASATSEPFTIANASLGQAQYEVPAGPDRPSNEPVARPTDRTSQIDSPLKEQNSRRQPIVDPTALGRIEIPRLGVSAIVRDGADDDTLARAVGLVPGTAKPGESGNMVLAGHRDTFFRPLRRIEIDDVIRMVVPPHTYEYRVSSLRVVAPTETSVLESNGIDELTLVTCYPFRLIGPAPDRYIVSATRIN